MSVDLIGKHTRKPWALVIAILVAAVLGSIAIPVQVILSRQSKAASQEQVERNGKVTHNNQANLCQQINRVLQAQRLTPDACPSVER